jgi:hypothetical protein
LHNRNDRSIKGKAFPFLSIRKEKSNKKQKEWNKNYIKNYIKNAKEMWNNFTE